MENSQEAWASGHSQSTQSQRQDGGGGIEPMQYWNQLKEKTVNADQERLANGLGWFSIGLGLAEVLAPRALCKFLGVKDHSFLVRLMGLREIAAGLGILTQRKPAEWLWARVGGDVLDLTLLGAAAKSETANRGRIALSTFAVAGVTAMDVCCAQELSRGKGYVPEDRTLRVTKTLTINCPPEQIYAFWKDFQNLPKFMRNLESVLVEGTRSHWVAKGPGGRRIEWDAETTEDRPDEMIAWRTTGRADIQHSGSVRFRRAPGNRGTIVVVEMEFGSKAASFMAGVARAVGQSPEQLIAEDLRHLQQILEAGEIITTEGQPAGRPSSTSWKYDWQIWRDRDVVNASPEGAEL